MNKIYVNKKRRALGQHFLRDTEIASQIASRILEKAKEHQCHSLLEIGPGKGAITLPLLEMLKGENGAENRPLNDNTFTIRQFFLVETDVSLANRWMIDYAKPQKKTELNSEIHIEVEPSDFLILEPQRWQEYPPVGVVSNLPYSVGTVILERLAAQRSKIPVMVLMFQAEVARRLYAEVGSRDCGRLSLWIQNRWNVTKLLSVPPAAFSPPPEVNSEVVLLERRPEEIISLESERDERQWQSLLKTCFGQRRKMLRSVLPRHSRNALELCGIDGTKRAEALQWSEWIKLFHALRG